MNARPSPIDRAFLQRYTAGDAALEAEVFSLFREQAKMWLRLLEPSGDDESWSSAAHSLKGAANGLGAFKLADACAEAETLIGDDASAVRRSLAAQTVRAGVDQVLAYIAQEEYLTARASLGSTG